MALLFHPALRAMLAVVICLAAGPAQAETGYLWELHNEMVMTGEFDGMLPSNTQKVCAPKRQLENPGLENDCAVLESSRSGNKGHWKAKCKDGITVTSDFTFQGETAYQGVVTSTSDAGSAKMKISGKRLGSCTLGATTTTLATGNTQACEAAVKQKNYRFIANECPEHSRQMRQKHCDGQGKPNKYRELCDALGAEVVSEGEASDTPSDSVASNVKEELSDHVLRQGVDKVKGLLSF